MGVNMNNLSPGTIVTTITSTVGPSLEAHHLIEIDAADGTPEALMRATAESAARAVLGTPDGAGVTDAAVRAAGEAMESDPGTDLVSDQVVRLMLTAALPHMQADTGSWVCGRCGLAPEAHSNPNSMASECIYDPVFRQADTGEVERLRAEVAELQEYAPMPEMRRLLRKSSLGTDEAEAARGSVSNDAGAAIVQLSKVMAERDAALAEVERHGPCTCTSGPDIQGPDERCPRHGRTFHEVLERGDILQERAHTAKQQINAVRKELARSFAMSAVNSDPHVAWRDAVAYVKDAVLSALDAVDAEDGDSE